MKKPAILKQIVCILLTICFLASLGSCQVMSNNSNGQTDEQTEEHTTEETTEQESETETEASTEAVTPKQAFEIRLTSKGTLTVYSWTGENTYSGRSVYKVKKCYARIVGSKHTHEISLTSLRGSSDSISSYACYDLIYVIFESGHMLSDKEKEVIEEYGILYGFQ